MKTSKSALYRFFRDNRCFLGWTATSLLIAFVGGFVPTGFSQLIGELIDNGIAGEYAQVLRVGLTLAVLAAAEMMRSLLYGPVNAIGSERMFKSMRLRVWHSLSHADTATLENDFTSGDTLSRISGDMSTLCEALTGQLPWMLRVVVSGLVALIYCICLSWQLSVVYMVLLPLSVYWIKRISNPMKSLVSDQSKHTGEAMNVASDALHGITTIKTFQLEDEMDTRFGQGCDMAANKAIQNERVAVRLTAAKMLLTSLPICSLLFLVIRLLSHGMLTVGAVVAFITASRSVDAAFRLSDSIAAALRRSEAMAERIYGLLDIPLEKQSAMTDAPREDMLLRLENVTFSYPTKEPILQSLSLDIPRGQKVGLVGASGCGKSSILNLICGFYLPNEGDVWFKGLSTRAWDPALLRKNLSIVTQDTYLFDGTIRDNIVGSTETTDADIHQALANASLSAWVAELPDGIDTRVNELGSRLSGGQRQRMAIARALLKDAPVILLDEPTSALDQKTQIDLRQTLATLIQDRTAIVVSHQFSLLKDLDWIFYIEEGRVVEQGTVERVIASKGPFFHMMEEQMKEETHE